MVNCVGCGTLQGCGDDGVVNHIVLSNPSVHLGRVECGEGGVIGFLSCGNSSSVVLSVLVNHPLCFTSLLF